ncbi:hypothetical protein JTE90_001575 [Oedothorax gibbosus]|uniref:ferroxidase n=1 Tax=Oedothorax gibbosus TaxID=931172 RepID=A0AAV6VNH9_9ARAC|nr:hypothetical protein JTE90_001575 [Oedothorax gibbosus]
MSCATWRKGSEFARLRWKTIINRILFAHFRQKSSSAITLKKTIFTVQHQFLKNTNFQILSINTFTDKPNSITTSVEYEEISEETLQSIGDRFEELLEDSNLNDWDVNYSNDVLTVSLNKDGTYVLNKQSPNRQIWLSSPFSGPKRYDYVNGTWIYKHDGKSVHQLLSEEFSKIVQKDVDFMKCSYSKEN